MLLQAAGTVVSLTRRTCLSEKLSQDGEPSSLSRRSCSCSRFKTHLFAKGAQSYLSGNALFASQYSNLCKTYVCRHLLCRSMELHRIPTGLHRSRKSSFRRTVAVAARNKLSNEDISQQEKYSEHSSLTMHKTTQVLARGVKVDGLEDIKATTNGNINLESAHLLNAGTSSSEKIDSEAPSTPTKHLIGGIQGLKDWWKAVNKVYKADTAAWGYGSSPIFTVYEGPDGKIKKVSINKKEIQRRQGVEPLLPGFGDDTGKDLAERNLVRAQNIATDLEMGKMDFDRHSTVFTLVKHPRRIGNQTTQQKLRSQIDFAIHKATPVLKSVLMIAVPVYGIYVLFGAYLFVTKQSEDDIAKEEKSAASLEKMRKLKAQMNTRRESAGVGQPPLDSSEFMQKVLEVREMARKVRSEEGLQKSTSDSHTDVEEFQPQEKSELDLLRSTVQIAVTENQGGRGHEDVIVTEVLESRSPIMDDMGAITKDSSVHDASMKPPPRVKPRIITSLDEAMAVIGSEQIALTIGDNVSPDLSGTAKRASSDEGTLTEDESGTTSNSQGVLAEALHSDFDQITPTSPEGHVRAEEVPNMESPDVDVPQNGVHLRSDSTDLGTRDSFASEGGSKEAQGLDHEFKEGSDSSHLPSESLKNMSVSEVQTSSTARPSGANNLTQKPVISTSNQTSGGVLPSARSKNYEKRSSADKPILDIDMDEVVGSGQPLRRRPTRTNSNGAMSNTKRWSRELQRKYELERDPEIRGLMKEIGSELDSWVSEEEVEEVSRLASKLVEGDDKSIQQDYEKLLKKLRNEKEKFGMEAVMEKYKEYQPKPEDELWWVDLRCVLCLMVVTAKEEGKGLYGLDMTIESEDLNKEGIIDSENKNSRGIIESENMNDHAERHVIAFEDRKDALNFCHLMEHRSGSRFLYAEVCPFSPKKLFEIAKEEKFKVSVIRAGQIQTNVDQTLEEVEEQILQIGRSVYWEKVERDNSIDIDSILHQRFGV